MSHPSGYRALRKGRHSAAGHVYFVTTVAKYRRPIFRQWGVARHAARVLGDPLMWFPHRCLCWMLMPDHWHGLLQLRGDGSLSAAVRKAKSESARRVARCTGDQGGIWAAGFHDRALRRHEDVRAVARYIVGNPLRAGLVEDVLQYPYWDAIWMPDGKAPVTPEPR